MNQFIISSVKLLEALEQCIKAMVPASKKPVIPIIENFLLEVSADGKAIIYGTDFQSWLGVRVNDEAKKTGPAFAACISPELLKYLKKTDHQPIRLEFEDIQNYMSNDDFRPSMTGVSFQEKDGKYYLCATDGHILKRVHLDTLKKVPSVDYIIPAKTVKILSTCGPKKSSPVLDLKIKTSKGERKHACFIFGDIILFSRIIDERFPNIWAVIPDKTVTQYTVNRPTFNKQLDKAELMANQTTKLVVFDLNLTENHIKSRDLDFGKEFKGSIGGSHMGEPIVIGFHAGKLKRVIDSFEGDFMLKMVAPNRAAVIEEGNSLALLMPVMLSAEEIEF